MGDKNGKDYEGGERTRLEALMCAFGNRA